MIAIGEDAYIRYPQDVTNNEDGTITIIIRKKVNDVYDDKLKIIIPGGTKDLLRDIDIVLATIKSGAF